MLKLLPHSLAGKRSQKELGIRGVWSISLIIEAGFCNKSEMKSHVI